jgi:dipeptidyl aminopeptidase/acylaminoacyl peptidase
MGAFDNLGAAAGGDWAKQAADAQKMADQMMKDSGYGASTADAAAAAPAMAADRAALEAQADEQNRILSIGDKGKITIVKKTDTGKKVAGNDTWLLELKVEPDGGKAYTVKKEEIIPPQVISGYADGTTLDGRIDPADKNKVAFGDKPFK